MVSKIKRTINDIFNYKIGRLFFKNPRFILAVKLCVLMLFCFALFEAFFAPNAQNHIANALFWSLFWPFFMVLSLATLGRVFCGICPHRFIGQILNKYALYKTPKFLRNRFIGTAILLLSYWSMLYFFYDLLDSALASGIFFFVFTVYSFVIFSLFTKMDYCRYFCPIASVTNEFSKNAFMFLATYQSACSVCKGFECAKACPHGLSPFTFEKKESMHDCTLCMECTRACEAVGFFVKKPAFALQKVKKNESFSGAWTVFSITVVALISMSFYNALGASPLSQLMPWVVLGEQTSLTGVNTEGFFAVLFALCFTGVFTLCIYIVTAKIFHLPVKEVFKAGIYSLVPLVLFGALAQTLPFFFTTYAPNIVSAFLNHSVGAFIEKTDPVLRAFVLFHFVGLGVSSYVLYKRTALFAKNRLKLFAMLSCFHIAYLCLIGFIIYAYVSH